MKKIYINPTIEVVNINISQHIMTGSETIDVHTDKTVDDFGVLQSRDFDFDDEEY